MQVNELIGRLTRKGSTKGLDAGVVLDYLNRVHLHLCKEFPLYTGSTEISVQANVPRYALPSGLIEVRLATWHTSAGSMRPLEPMTVAQLDRDDRLWRERTARDPVVFYMEAGQIGLHHCPSVSTVAGYPKVVLSTRLYTPLALGGEMPIGFDCEELYFWGVRQKSAMDNDEDPSMADAYFEREMLRAENYLGQRASHVRDVPIPDLYFPDVY